MKKKSFIALIIIIFVMTSATVIAGGIEEDKILSVADNLFVHMKNKDYKAIWGAITSKTQEIIIDDVYKASKKQKSEITKEYLASDFSSSGKNAQAYWDSYLTVFNPDMVLEECDWKMGNIKKSEAEIVLQYKKSDKPAILKMYKENDEWKVGLEESFRVLKINPF